MNEYKIVSAIKSGEYESKFGTMHKYIVQFEGQPMPVELSQKPETPVPKTGDSLHGTIEDTQYGKKFKKVQNNTFGNSPVSKEFKADPLKQASIERQVALKCAIDLLAAKLPQMKDQPKSGELAKVAIEIANVFDDFLKNETLEKEKTEVAELLTASEEVPFTDEEINLDEIQIA